MTPWKESLDEKQIEVKENRVVEILILRIFKFQKRFFSNNQLVVKINNNEIVFFNYFMDEYYNKLNVDEKQKK